jgi:hypothetical protein
MLIAEVVQKQERIEILGFAEAESALQFHASAFNCGLRLNDLFNRTE